jgi:hypothetical protein
MAIYAKSVGFAEQGSTPANPSAGNRKLYFKTDGKLYKLNSAGTEVEVAGSGGAGDVVGPTGANADYLAVFDGATGKLLKDGGAVPTLATLGGLPKVMAGDPATHTANGITTATFAAGATIGEMALVYMGSSSKWLVCDADAIATCGLLALSLEAKNDTEAMSVLLQGIVADASWSWTAGGAIYASGTPGALTQTQPAGADGVIRVLGYALTATVMYFRPDMSWITHT